MGETMLVGTIDGPHSASLREVPVPEPTPDTLVVEITYCGICGTDVHAYESGAPYPPAVCGHEWAGVISATGSSVTGLDEGDRVVVAVPGACGSCEPCMRGQTDYCVGIFLAQVGVDALAPPHGGFAPSIRVGPGRVMRANPKLSDREAAQIEPATVTFHAVVRSGIRLGDTVVVQGAGPIGLLTMQWARVAGAATVIVSEPDPRRRALATSVGADHALAPDEVHGVLMELTRGLGADVVYECVGRPETVQSAVDQVRRGGSVSIIGLSGTDAPITPGTWLVKEVTVTASLAYLRDEFERVMSVVADGRLQLEPLHDHTVGLGGFADALAALAAGGSAFTKVLVDPSDGRR